MFDHINRVPTEIWHIIIELLSRLYSSKHDLSSIRLTCRTFSEIAFTYQWRRFKICSLDGVKKLENACNEDERISKAVRQIIVYRHALSGLDEQAESQIATRFTNLEELDVRGWIRRGFLEHAFALPSLKVCKLAGASLRPPALPPTPPFASQLSTLTLGEHHECTFHDNPSPMSALTCISTLRNLCMPLAGLEGYLRFKHTTVVEFGNDSFNTPHVHFLTLKTSRPIPFVNNPNVLAFINDCKMLRSLDTTECDFENADTSQVGQRLTVRGLSAIRGSPRVVAKLRRGLSVPNVVFDFNWNEDPHSLLDAEVALTCGSGPVSQISIQNWLWHPEILPIISRSCPALQELHYEARMDWETINEEVLLSELLAELSKLPKLSKLSLLFSDQFHVFQGDQWKFTCGSWRSDRDVVARLGDEMPNLRRVQLSRTSTWKRTDEGQEFHLFHLDSDYM